MVIDAGDIYLASLSPDEDKLLIVSVPKETYVDVPYGFGYYPIGAVYKLGDIEKRGGGVLSFTAQEFFALPVDGWVKFGTFESSLESGTAKSLVMKVIRPDLIKGNATKTNLTFMDRIRLWLKLRQIGPEKITFLSLKKSEVLTDLILPDNTTVKTADLGRLDRILIPFISESKIEGESLKIEVLNATPHLGVAGRVSRLITNLGGQVMNVGNENETHDHCLIRVNRENVNKKIVQKLKKVYSCQIKITEMSEDRVDISFIVGGDYWQKLTKDSN